MILGCKERQTDNAIAWNKWKYEIFQIKYKPVKMHFWINESITKYKCSHLDQNSIRKPGKIEVLARSPKLFEPKFKNVPESKFFSRYVPTTGKNSKDWTMSEIWPSTDRSKVRLKTELEAFEFQSDFRLGSRNENTAKHIFCILYLLWPMHIQYACMHAFLNCIIKRENDLHLFVNFTLTLWLFTYQANIYIFWNMKFSI